MAPAIAATHMTHEMGPASTCHASMLAPAATKGRSAASAYASISPLGPGSASYFTAVADAEMLPRPENRVPHACLAHERPGAPTLHIAWSHDPQPSCDVAKMQVEALRKLSEIAGARLHGYLDTLPIPGSSIHECGTARTGSDPSQSVLDPFNECWDAKGLFVSPIARPFPRSDCRTRRSPSGADRACLSPCRQSLKTRAPAAPQLYARSDRVMRLRP